MDKNIVNFNVRLRTIKIRELIIGLIITIVLSTILSIIYPPIDESDELFFVVFLFIATLLFILVLRNTKGIKSNINEIFEDKNKKEIIFVFIANILFAFLITFLICYLDMLISIGDPSWISIWDVDAININSDAIIFDAIGSIIFAPVIEELVFRGILFNRLKIRIGILPSMIISSLIFAFGHDFGGITSAFLFGICMCILYLKTDNIFIPISVHFINNLTATLLSISSLDIIISQMPWIATFTIVSIIGSVFLIMYIFKEIKKLKNEYK